MAFRGSIGRNVIHLAESVVSLLDLEQSDVGFSRTIVVDNGFDIKRVLILRSVGRICGVGPQTKLRRCRSRLARHYGTKKLT